MFDMISLLGFAVAAIHQAGLGRAARLGGPDPADGYVAEIAAPPIVGHLDVMETEAGITRLSGWAYAPDWPGASVAVEVRADGRIVAVEAADQARPDLAVAGIGDGRHGFTITVAAEMLDDAMTLTVGGIGSERALEGGERALKR